MLLSRKIYFDESKSCPSFSLQDQNFFLQVLNNERAWPFQWSITQYKNQADWSVRLETDTYIQNASDQYSIQKRGNEYYGLSVTFMDMQPKLTMFSEQNWLRVPLVIRNIYSTLEYRIYVILHECGHALGLGHSPEVANQPVPIMYQATKGLFKGFKNIWPLNREVSKIEEMYY